MGKMSPVVHFEMPAKDNKRASDFYTKVFGWEMQQMGEDMGGYLLATTTPTDPKTTRPTTPGAINGGFFKAGDYGTVPHLVIAVEDLQKSIEDVKKSGGEITGDVMDIPGVGKFVMIKDTEDNRVGMLQPPSM